MRCPKCKEEVTLPLTWQRMLQNVVFMLVMLGGYQLTLTFFVSRYDGDEIRNIFLLLGNIIIGVVSAWAGKKGLEKFVTPARPAGE